MARLPCHRVFFRNFFRNAVLNINERIFCHHRLVHTVKGQKLPAWAEKRSFPDAVFVAMDARTIGNLPGTVSADLMLLPFSRLQEQVPVFRIGLGTAGGAELIIVGTGLFHLRPDD